MRGVIKPVLFSFFVVYITLSGCVKDPDGTPEFQNVPVLQFENIEIAEQDIDDTLNVTVTLAGENKTNAIVRFAVLPGAAAADVDYKLLSENKLVFSPEKSTAVIQFLIIGDGVREGKETFTIQYYNPINMQLIEQKQIVTIADDDDNTAGLQIPASGYKTPLSYPGYKLQWADEFDSTALNPSIWVYETGTGNGGWGNNELQYYREDNTTLVNGHLVITAKAQKFGNRNFTSSRLKTQGKKSMKFGRVDVRASLPKGQGIWPAIWMLGTNISSVGWPACGEIDIMELTGDQPKRAFSTIHFGPSPDQRQLRSQYFFLEGEKSFHDEFHVFSMVWKENLIEMYIDDQKYHTITPATLGNIPYPFNKSFFFILNVAVGGNLPGSPDATTPFPQSMIVDYIRVFQPE
jgi:beta-glucanase (GH16 family)